jgi:hypothetical protein
LDVKVASASIDLVGWALGLNDAWCGVGGNASVGDTKSTRGVWIGSLQNLWVGLEVVKSIEWETTLATVVSVALRA